MNSALAAEGSPSPQINPFSEACLAPAALPNQPLQSTSRIDFAHVYLAQAACVGTEYPIRLRHCGVALPCMSDVEAKHRLGEFFKNDIQFF